MPLAVELLSISDALQVWWPVIVGYTLAVLYVARVEGVTRMLRQMDDAAANAAVERWAAHERETAPVTKRIDEALARIESHQERAADRLDQIDRRLTRVEGGLNGAVVEWNRKTERRQT